MNNLTIEQVAIIFAMHLGQLVQYQDSNIPTNRPLGINRGLIYDEGRPEVCLEWPNNPDDKGGFYNLHNAKLLLRPLSAITNEELTTLIGIFLGKAPKMMNISEATDQYSRFIICEYNREKSLDSTYDEVSMHLTIDCYSGRIQNSWNYINSKGIGVSPDHLSNDGMIEQYLIQKGFARPLFIAPNHPDNGKTAIELGLAIESK